MSTLYSQLASAGDATAQHDYAATGLVQAYPAVGAWPGANTAILVKVRVAKPVRVASIVVGIGTASGNVDAGIYDSDGTTWTRRASSGSTAAAGTNAMQTLAMTTPIWLTPGKDWWIAVAADNTTVTMPRAALNSFLSADAQQNIAKVTSFPLPATLTALTTAVAYSPYARTVA